MSEMKSQKTGNKFATVLIGIIILAFMFTGYQQFEGGGNQSSVGTVNGIAIKPEEFNQEYNRQLEFYKQIMGGDISAKQLESMGLKNMTIKNIVQRKLMVILANDLGTFPSEEEVKKVIKELPYFQTNNQFDITKYKGLLASNQLTPHEFETDVINQLKMQKVQQVLTNYPISAGYKKDLEGIRAQQVKAEIIEINKNSLSQFVPVSNEEVTKFLADETNAKRVESMFNERLESLSTPEQVDASHILLMTQGKDENQVKAEIEKIAKEANPKNFATLANKFTEDPSGKNNGGALGFFGKGAMVPEFEQVAFSQAIGTVSAPVKTSYGYHLIYVKAKKAPVLAELKDHRTQFAKDIIQKDKIEELKNLTVDVANQTKAALESNNKNALKTLVAKYKIKQSDTSINRLDGAANGTMITADQMKSIFTSDFTKPQFHSFDDGSNIVMVKTNGIATSTDAENKANSDGLQNALGQKMMDSIMKGLEAKAKVKINENMLQSFN